MKNRKKQFMKIGAVIAVIAAAGIGSPFDRGRSLQMEKITRFFKKLLYFVASVVVIKL